MRRIRNFNRIQFAEFCVTKQLNTYTKIPGLKLILVNKLKQLFETHRACGHVYKLTYNIMFPNYKFLIKPLLFEPFHVII